MSDFPDVDQAVQVAQKLKAGTWESVESLAILGQANPSHPQAPELYASALAASRRLKAGTYDAVRALTWLAVAEQALADR